MILCLPRNVTLSRQVALNRGDTAGEEPRTVTATAFKCRQIVNMSLVAYIPYIAEHNRSRGALHSCSHRGPDFSNNTGTG